NSTRGRGAPESSPTGWRSAKQRAVRRSDRIGTPSGQSYYATVSKNLKRETRLPIAPYFGVAHGTYESRTRPIGGLSVGFAEWLTGLAIFDGVHVHPTLSAQWSKSVFTFLLVRGKHPGVSYSIVF
ncbi:MAG: hypothetical protein ACRD96_04730, partial [Bryobacteraceae bacterium]